MWRREVSQDIYTHLSAFIFIPNVFTFHALKLFACRTDAFELGEATAKSRLSVISPVIANPIPGGNRVHRQFKLKSRQFHFCQSPRAVNAQWKRYYTRSRRCLSYYIPYDTQSGRGIR